MTWIKWKHKKFITGKWLKIIFQWIMYLYCYFFFSYSSFVRDFFQNRYDSVVNLFGVNDLYLDVFATLIISLSVYWSIGTLYTILDVTQRPKFLYKYKIQDEKVSSISLALKLMMHISPCFPALVLIWILFDWILTYEYFFWRALGLRLIY